MGETYLRVKLNNAYWSSFSYSARKEDFEKMEFSLTGGKLSKTATFAVVEKFGVFKVKRK